MNTPIHVWWLTNRDDIDAHGPWDTRILDDLFSGELWPHDREFVHHYNVNAITRADERGIVVLPARHHTSDADLDWLNGQISKLRSLILFLAGDEEGTFPWKRVRHKPDNCRFWIQHPNPVKHREMLDWSVGLRFYGCGSPIKFGGPLPDKDILWSFLGQVTHPGRQQAVHGLQRARARVPGRLSPTAGFRQGVPQEEYAEILKRTRIAPCPAGPATPDSFRFYEALEAGCYPIVDEASPGGQPGYWDMAYDHFPFRALYAEEWNGVAGDLETVLADWPAAGNRASAWWLAEKRMMAWDLEADLRGIGFDPPEIPWWRRFTALITTSPVPSNPSTAMIETVIDSLYQSTGHQVPIVIACDGVRPEQADMAPAYDEYVRALCWKAQHEWSGVQVLAPDEHLHQIRLTQRAVDEIPTDLFLFMEHDTPFYPEAAIDWAAAVDAMEYGVLDVLRFHHESSIPAPHRYLLLDEQPTKVYDLPVQRIKQWSQRPHLTSVAYYRRMLKWIDRAPNNGFIEDAQYTVALHDPTHHRIALYAPEGTLLRTHHLDGRADAPKFDGEFLPR